MIPIAILIVDIYIVEYYVNVKCMKHYIECEPDPKHEKYFAMCVFEFIVNSVVHIQN